MKGTYKSGFQKREQKKRKEIEALKSSRQLTSWITKPSHTECRPGKDNIDCNVLGKLFKIPFNIDQILNSGSQMELLIEALNINLGLMKKMGWAVAHYWFSLTHFT